MRKKKQRSTEDGNKLQSVNLRPERAFREDLYLSPSKRANAGATIINP